MAGEGRKILHRGFFSFEAGIAAMVLILLAAMSAHSGGYSSSEVFGAQKASDLLIVWAHEATPEKEMGKDAEFFLEGEFEAYAGGRKIAGSISGKKYFVEISRLYNGEREKISIALPSR